MLAIDVLAVGGARHFIRVKVTVQDELGYLLDRPQGVMRFESIEVAVTVHQAMPFAFGYGEIAEEVGDKDFVVKAFGFDRACVAEAVGGANLVVVAKEAEITDR